MGVDMWQWNFQKGLRKVLSWIYLRGQYSQNIGVTDKQGRIESIAEIRDK